MHLLYEVLKKEKKYFYIVTGHWRNDQGFFYLDVCAQTGSDAHPASCRMGICKYITKDKTNGT